LTGFLRERFVDGSQEIADATTANNEEASVSTEHVEDGG
jgi:hypothetical protein